MNAVGIALCLVFLCITSSGSALLVCSDSQSITPASSLGFSVDYWAFNGTGWTKDLINDEGTDVECKVLVSDAVGLILTLTVVLPAGLDFTGEATPPPSNTSGNDLGGMNLYWTYETGGGSQTVLFHVRIAGEGTFESLAAGILLLPPLSDTDSINITGVGVNHPPLKPATPSGNVKGKVGVIYSYTSSTTDPAGDQVYYLWDFGDGTKSNWLGPYSSSEVASVDHSWSKRGSYQVKVQAKDIFNATSDWSDPLPVSMPKSRVSLRVSDFLSHHPFLMRLVGLLSD